MVQWKQILRDIPRKLSGPNAVLLGILNGVLPLAALPACMAAWRYQSGGGEAVPGFYRAALPVMFLFVLGMAALNVVFLLNPLLQLQHLVDRFRATRTVPRQGASGWRSSALEEAFFDILEEQKNAMEREYKTEILMQQTELMALQSQINPHFLYNTLDSIRGLALLHDADDIARMTEALSRLFRSMIAREGKMISLAEELESVENYMLIQKFRFNNRFSCSTCISPPELRSCMVPNLVLQPIVENAVMHGLEKKEGPGRIVISVSATRDRLLITVEDDGMGMDVPRLTALNARLMGRDRPSSREDRQHSGIALTNIHSRIRLQFGETYGLNIMSTENINTVVELVLPLLREEKR